MPLAFLTIWLGSISDKTVRATAERHAFDAQFVQSETGIRSTEILAGATT
jgi:cation/acetate symporter